MTVVSDVTYTLSAGVPTVLSLPFIPAAHASISWLVYSPGEDLEFLEAADSEGAILVPSASGVQKVGPFRTKVGLPRLVRAADATTVRIIGIRDESSTTVTVGPQPEEGGGVVETIEGLHERSFRLGSSTDEENGIYNGWAATLTAAQAFRDAGGYPTIAVDGFSGATAPGVDDLSGMRLKGLTPGSTYLTIDDLNTWSSLPVVVEDLYLWPGGNGAGRVDPVFSVSGFQTLRMKGRAGIFANGYAGTPAFFALLEGTLVLIHEEGAGTYGDLATPGNTILFENGSGADLDVYLRGPGTTWDKGCVDGAGSYRINGTYGITLEGSTQAGVTLDANDTDTWIDDAAVSLPMGAARTVQRVSDFPDPVGGVITLPAGSSWLITDDVDLGSNRIECAGPLALKGISPETCILRGSHTANPLVAVDGSLTLRDLAVNVPATGTGVRVDGSGGGAAVDWFGVNFTGSGQAVEFEDVTNAVLGLCAFLGPNGIDVSGDIDTLALTDSLVSVATSGQVGINFNTGAMVNRRFRVGNCAFVVGTGATGISATPAEIASSEAFILNWVNFAGGGTLIDGTAITDDSARWTNCRGIANTARAAALYSSGNATATTIPAQGTYAKAANTTTANTLNQRFSHTDNRLTYTSAFDTTFKVEAVISAFAGNNRIIGLQVFKNGIALEGPAGLGTSTGNLAAERAQNIVYSNIVELEENDYLEVFVTCLSHLSNVTVAELSLVVTEL